ncbi:MAG: DUF1858 domain-containing protein [Clostridiales bacterium]|nr:DUF1858 domain-containing protein [Candidatus Blautia equi]
MEQLITRDMTIAEILKVNSNLAAVLESVGMHCVGCAASLDETLEVAVMVHNIDLNNLLTRLNILANALAGK